MNVDLLKKQFVPKYVEIGDERFYSFLLSYGINKLVAIENGNYNGLSPDMEFLDYYDKFIVLYRREGDSVYLKLAVLLRKAAHKIYRVMCKRGMTKNNEKFLRLV